MYRKTRQFLCGRVHVQIDCAMPERVFNLCGAHDIPFWNVSWSGCEQFSFVTTVNGFRRLRHVTGELPCRIRVQRRDGAPVLLRRLRRRYAIVAALILALALLYGGSTYIWAFEVTGNDTVPTEKILRALEAQGVAIGVRGMSIDQETLRNHLLLALPDISWCAVNISGCTAHVQVVERKLPPPMYRDSEKANIVAQRAGLVTRVEALDGKAQVAKGSTVTKGQLLISGIVDSERTGVRVLHGLGRVYARTWYTLSCAVPLTVQERTVVRETTKTSVLLGKKRINFFARGSVLGDSCDKISKTLPVSLPFGFRLPVTLVQETLVQYETAPLQRSAEQAQREGEQTLLHRLQGELCEDAVVTGTQFSSVRQGSYLLVTLRAECSEQIGQSVPIPDIPTP